MGKKIFLAPLGCPKNQVDAELMLGRAVAAGHEVVSDPQAADVLVVNTCAFIEAAREESVEAILRLARLKEGRSGRRLVVTGCMAERYTEELAEAVPEIDALVGTGAIERFAETLAGPTGAGRAHVFKGAKHYLPSALSERLLLDGDGSAYLKVSEGCDHDCAFCIIPQIRGRHASRPLDDVVAEAERLAAQGVVEVNLIAQDLSAYGKDLGLREGLAVLLHRLAEVAGLERIRCFYLYPNTLSDAALDAMAELDAVCPYVDMPLQHADPDILRAMRRARDTGQLRRILDRVRERIGDPVLRTAFIVGFPGETEAAFERLCTFVEEIRFDRVAVFAYSREQGSAAAALPGQVPAEVAERRRDQLLALHEPIAEQRQARHVGRRARVLVAGRDERGCWLGRTAFQAPEIDGLTYLGDDDLEAFRGRCLDVRITGSDAYDLFAEPIAASAAARGPRSRRSPLKNPLPAPPSEHSS